MLLSGCCPIAVTPRLGRSICQMWSRCAVADSELTLRRITVTMFPVVCTFLAVNRLVSCIETTRIHESLVRDVSK
jgi:hypothetical protein